MPPLASFFYDLTFNPAGPVSSGSGKPNPSAVPRIRQALNRLVDRQAIANLVPLGDGPGQHAVTLPLFTASVITSSDYRDLIDAFEDATRTCAFDTAAASQTITDEMAAPGAERVDGVPFDLAPDDASVRADAGHERVAYVPAQRVMSIRDGLTRPFGEHRAGDPYVLRAFSADVHDVVQKELSADAPIFPRPQRFNEPLRNVVAANVLAEWELRVEAGGLEKRFVLVDPTSHIPAPLPFLTWSAGQREFVPLLLGLYRLMPAGSRPRRGRLEWVVIEEPEMGLHPHAIAATMAFVLKLLRRRYRVVLSTHSTQVLDVVWGLRRLQSGDARWEDVLRMLGLESERGLRSAAGRALETTVATYCLERSAPTRDISDLDPLADDAAEAGWGELTAFSERVAGVVADVMGRSRSAVACA